MKIVVTIERNVKQRIEETIEVNPQEIRELFDVAEDEDWEDYIEDYLSGEAENIGHHMISSSINCYEIEEYDSDCWEYVDWSSV